MTYGAERTFDLLGVPHGESRSWGASFEELGQIWGDPRQLAGLVLFSAGIGGATAPRIRENVKWFAESRTMWEAEGLTPEQVDEVMASEDVLAVGSKLVNDGWKNDPAGMRKRIVENNKAIKERGEVLVLTGVGAMDAALANDVLAPAYAGVWRAYADRGVLPHVEAAADGKVHITKVDRFGKGNDVDLVLSAVDAVATLRETGQCKLDSEVVQLDGKSDWAQEEKVIRYVLRQPLNERELGTARALAATKERLFQDRRKRAATYAQAAAEHKALLKGKQAEISAAKEREKQEKKDAEKLQKVLKQADDERIAGYGRKVERKVTYGSLSGEMGAAEPAVVVIPRKMYAEAAGALGSGAGGFYAFLPGVKDGIPVMAGDVDAIQVNAPVLNLVDGKKDKLTGQQLHALSNEGLMVPVQFSAFQKF